ncbi:hypothetical protein WJ70_28715 [Burkholderia ubonensis]|nr:hypothetical protein WJ70_28715 [Burkholderia ubonensis]
MVLVRELLVNLSHGVGQRLNLQRKQRRNQLVNDFTDTLGFVQETAYRTCLIASFAFLQITSSRIVNSRLQSEDLAIVILNVGV